MSSGSGGWDFGSGQGYQPSQGPADRLGLTRIGPYEIQGEVARGGMGVVYRGHDLRLARPVAIKLLLAPGTQAQDSPRVRRFAREAEALASLSHPGLLGVYDFGVLPQPRVPYMITEWLEGQTLEDRLRQEGTLGVAEALDLTETIARAVAHAHGRGILHRDLKPSNVVLAPRGPVVIDFGLAKRQDPSQSRLTQTGAMAGTTGFAAPEQLRDATAVDERADVYGLGATLYALLTGFPPGGHEGRGLEVLAANATGKFPLPSELRPEVPRAVDRLVAKALALEPERRMSDAGEFADALAELATAPRGAGRLLGTLAAVLLLIGLGLGVGLAILAARGRAPLAGSSPRPTPSASASASPQLSWSPSPSASPSGAEEAPDSALAARVPALTQELKELELELLTTPVEPKPLAAIYARGRALSAGILAGAASAGERWPAIRHLVTAGRVEEAEPLLRELARDPEFVARANLELAWLALTTRRAEGLPPALRRAAEQSQRPGLDPDEVYAARMARILQRVLALGSNRSGASAIQIELSSLLREPQGDAWRKRVVWTTCVYAAILARVEFRPLISEAWGPARQEKLDLPRFSTISAWHLGLTSGAEPGVTEQLGAFFEAHRERIPSPAFHDTLSRGYAASGSLGGLERSLAYGTGLGPRAQEQLRRQAALVAGTRGGPLVGELRIPSSPDASARVEWLRVRVEPSQQTLGVWVILPSGTERWGVRLAGAEVDFDLRLRRDGPPLHAAHWEETSLTMARNERLEARGGGRYFLQLERATPWPVPLEVTLELYAPGPGSRLRLSRDPWEFKMPTTSVPGLREAFSASRQAFKEGRIEESLRVLNPFLERSSQAKYVRWSLLDFAARWEELGQDVAPSRQDAGPRGQLAAWLFARSKTATRQVAAAQEALAELTQRAPELLEAWTSRVVVEAGRGGVPGGRRVLESARERFPDAPVLGLMDLALSEAESSPAFRARFRELQGHSEARRQVIALLFFLRREQAALSLLDALPQDLRDLPRTLLYRAYALGRLGRGAEARALLAEVEPSRLSPQLAEQFKRARDSLGGG